MIAPTELDIYFMNEALKEAQKSLEINEVPVGAVLVLDNKIIARGHNQMISSSDPSAHAEMNAIRMATKFLNNYRILGTTLYITLEPCMMCSGAIILSRIARVVYGASDLKTGAHTSAFELLQHPKNNHTLEVTSGVLASECSQILSDFFKRRRLEIKEQKRQQRLLDLSTNTNEK